MQGGFNNSSPPHCIAPKEQVSLSHYEMLYRRPFVYVNDLFLDPEAQNLWSYTMAIGQFQEEICLWGVNKDPKESKGPPLYAPGTQVLIKVWKDRSPKVQLQLTCNTFFPHSSQGTRAWLLDSPLMSQAVEESRWGHSTYLWTPGRSQIPTQDYR